LLIGIGVAAIIALTGIFPRVGPQRNAVHAFQPAVDRVGGEVLKVSDKRAECFDSALSVCVC
jgi:hypothetical protein